MARSRWGLGLGGLAEHPKEGSMHETVAFFENCYFPAVSGAANNKSQSERTGNVNPSYPDKEVVSGAARSRENGGGEDTR